MDLVEMDAAQDPPICRIIEYTKFKYEQSKREKEKKKKQHIVEMKEIRFGPNTDSHDFNFKLNHARKFLEEGNKVKAFVHFRGRSIVYTDRGKVLLLEFADELSDIGKVEMLPSQGKRMYIILTPKAGYQNRNNFVSIHLVMPKVKRIVQRPRGLKLPHRAS